LDAVDFYQAGAGGVIFAAPSRSSFPEWEWSKWLIRDRRQAQPQALELLPGANLFNYRQNQPHFRCHQLVPALGQDKIRHAASGRDARWPHNQDRSATMAESRRSKFIRD
jgi:hypothetical protein